MVILEKLINDLKSKVQGLIKKRRGESQDEEVEEKETKVSDDGDTSTNVSEPIDQNDDDTASTSVGNQSILYKLKEKLKGKKESDDEDGTSVEGAKPDDKKKKIIRYVIIGAVVVLIGSEFFPSEEEAPTDPGTSATPGFKKPDRKKVVKTEEPVTPAVEEPLAEPVPETPETTEATPSETPTAETPVVEEPTIATEPTVTEPTPTSVEGTQVIDEGVDEPSSTPVTPTVSEDSIDGENPTAPDENLTDKILEDLEKQAKKGQVKNTKPEYVSPPDYEYRGRGLVYNCVGKHWACVDGPGYKACEDNSAGNKYLKKKAECYPFNVYDSQKGCENMQNRVVSSSAKTDFCKE